MHRTQLGAIGIVEDAQITTMHTGGHHYCFPNRTFIGLAIADQRVHLTGGLLKLERQRHADGQSDAVAVV